MVETKKIKKRRKTNVNTSDNDKIRAFYHKDKKILDKNKKIKQLQDERKILIEDINQLVSSFQDKAMVPTDDMDKWLHQLPLNSLRDLADFELGNKKDYNLFILHMRSQFRKDKDDRIEDLSKLNSEIFIDQVDVLLDKIECIQKNLDSEKDED